MSTLSELVLCLRKEKIGEQRRTLTDFFRSLLNVQRYSYVGRAYMGPVEKKKKRKEKDRVKTTYFWKERRRKLINENIHQNG